MFLFGPPVPEFIVAAENVLICKLLKITPSQIIVWANN